MHQSYDYDESTNQPTVTKEDMSVGSWLKAKAKAAHTNIIKRNRRKAVLNAVADSLLARVKVQTKARTEPKSKLDEIVDRVTAN